MTWWTALDAALSALLGVLVTFGGGRVVTRCFRMIDAHGHEPPEPSPTDDVPGDPEIDDARSSRTDLAEGSEAARKLRGGRWIGRLERLAVYCALLAGWKEAVTMVLAVKALARYPELRAGTESAVAERFIIGTFLSVLQACAAAALMLWLRGLIP